MAIGDWLVKRIKDLARTATSSDLTDGEFVAVDKTDGYTRKMTVAGLATWVLGKIKSLATTITTFRDGDVIPVDGSQGTAKMTAVSLASWIHGRWAAFVNALTAKTSFANGDKIPVVNGNTASAMAADDLLHTTSQNALAGNVAPLFDPNKPNDAGGYAYYTGNNVTYEGQNFVFIANHKAGAWNPLEVEHKPLSESINLQGVGEAVDEWLNNHPEATTTVPDNSLTADKFTDILRQETLNDYVTPEMFGAVGNATADDTAALQECLDYAFANGKSVYLPNSYKVTDSLDVHDWCVIRGNSFVRRKSGYNIYLVPNRSTSLDNPMSLFVCRDSSPSRYHHSFIDVTIKKSSGVCKCFDVTCPIDNNSIVTGCCIDTFNTVFGGFIGHVSWVVRNRFSAVMTWFCEGNVTDGYILNNEITGYRPFAPICFKGNINYSEVSHNFFDFWFGIFRYIQMSKISNNQFDYCFWTFGYLTAFGNIGALRLNGTVTGNVWTNCANCHTSTSGFAGLDNDILVSLYGEFKLKVLKKFFPCSILFAFLYYNESTDTVKPGGYYNLLNGTIVGNRFDGAGIILTGIAVPLSMVGNSYEFNCTQKLGEQERIYMNFARHSDPSSFNLHLQGRIDIFEYLQLHTAPNEYMTHTLYGEANFRLEGCPVYYENKQYICRWSSQDNRFMFYDCMGVPYGSNT